MAEWWQVDLLDRLDRMKATLTGDDEGLPRVRGGRLEWSQFRAVPGSGTLELTSEPSTPVDLMTDRLRITHHAGDVATPFGIWLLSTSGWKRSGPVTTTTYALSDKTELLNVDTGGWVTYPAGTLVTAAVAAIIRAHGETQMVIEDSTTQLATSMSWEDEGTTWLQVANQLLGAINYASLWADGHGLLHVEPYVPLAQRAVGATYGAGGERMRANEWTDEAEIWDLPTGFRVIVDGDEDSPGFIGVADLPDEHPLSAASRGRRILRRERGEAPTLAIAHQIAARRLDESLQVTRRATMTHPVDGSQVGDIVTHGPLGLTGPIVQRSVELGLGAVVTDTIRRIYTGGDLPWR